MRKGCRRVVMGRAGGRQKGGRQAGGKVTLGWVEDDAGDIPAAPASWYVGVVIGFWVYVIKAVGGLGGWGLAHGLAASTKSRLSRCRCHGRKLCGKPEATWS